MPQKDPTAHREYNKQWARKNKDKHKAYRDQHKDGNE